MNDSSPRPKPPQANTAEQAAIPVLELKNVSIELSGDLILKDVNLKVNHGDTVVVIGPSGAGKTVLLKTLAGIFRPKAGESYCFGVPWHDRNQVSRHDLARKIGMQFQRSALFDELTVSGNIDFVLKEHTTLNETERKERILECLKSVKLEKYADYREHMLSGGMKQRVGIARSLALKPEILFMDDPTAGLDPVNSDDMAALILDLKNSINATMVVVTHDILRAYQFAGRIVLVANQTVIETGSAEETKNHKSPLVQQFINGLLHGPLTDDKELM